VDGTRWTLGGGVELQSTTQRIRSAGVDSAANVPSAGAPATATIPGVATWEAPSNLNSVFGETGLLFANGASIQGSVRGQFASMVANNAKLSILPAVRASYDLVRGRSSTNGDGMFTSAIVRAEFWRDAPEVTPYTLQSMYSGRSAAGSLAPLG